MRPAPWRACARKSVHRSFKTGCKARSGAGWMSRLASPLRVCPCTPSPQTSRCARCRDVRVPDPAHVQRDTASDGMTRAWTQPKWRSQQQRRVRPAGQGRRTLASPLLRRTFRQRGFESRTRRHQQSSRADHPRGPKPAATIGRHRNPSPEPSFVLFTCLINSGVRAPACLAGSRGFESRMRRQTRVSLAQLDQSAGLRSRRSHVRVVHETPTHLDVAKWPKASGCNPDGASPRQFKSDRRVQLLPR